MLQLWLRYRERDWPLAGSSTGQDKLRDHGTHFLYPSQYVIRALSDCLFLPEPEHFPERNAWVAVSTRNWTSCNGTEIALVPAWNLRFPWALKLLSSWSQAIFHLSCAERPDLHAPLLSRESAQRLQSSELTGDQEMTISCSRSYCVVVSVGRGNKSNSRDQAVPEEFLS